MEVELTDVGKAWLQEHYPQGIVWEYDINKPFRLHGITAKIDDGFQNIQKITVFILHKTDVLIETLVRKCRIGWKIVRLISLSTEKPRGLEPWGRELTTEAGYGCLKENLKEK